MAHELLVAARGIPDQGSNRGPLHWKSGVLATGPPGKSSIKCLKPEKLLRSSLHSPLRTQSRPTEGFVRGCTGSSKGRPRKARPLPQTAGLATMAPGALGLLRASKKFSLPCITPEFVVPRESPRHTPFPRKLKGCSHSLPQGQELSSPVRQECSGLKTLGEGRQTPSMQAEARTCSVAVLGDARSSSLKASSEPLLRATCSLTYPTRQRLVLTPTQHTRGAGGY